MAYIFNDNKIFVMAVGRHRQSFFKDFIYRVSTAYLLCSKLQVFFISALQLVVAKQVVCHCYGITGAVASAGVFALSQCGGATVDATHVEIEFTSSNEDVATVNSDGEINAVDIGETTITASIKETDITAECIVTVAPDIESIELSDTSLKMKKDGTAQLTATANPDGASIDGIAFASDAPDVATVDKEGNVTAIADGKATITASVGDVSAECVVTVDSTSNSPTGSASSGTNGNSNGGSSDTSSSASAPAASSSFEYGALPMDPATDGETWWSIDSSDSAYWAVANNINAMRADGGLPALTVSSSLSSIADSRCEYLIANDVFSHDGATTAEILCSGATSASAACTGWKNSPSHYSNIMTPGYTQMGIGCIFNTAYGVEVWCVTFS